MLRIAVGAVLGVQQEGDVGHEGRYHLGQVQLRDRVGLQLFLVVQLCQVLLFGLTEINRGAHSGRFVLEVKEYRRVGQIPCKES